MPGDGGKLSQVLGQVDQKAVGRLIAVLRDLLGAPGRAHEDLAQQARPGRVQTLELLVNNDFSYSMAIGVINLIINVCFILLFNRLAKSKQDENSLW